MQHQKNLLTNFANNNLISHFFYLYYVETKLRYHLQVVFILVAFGRHAETIEAVCLVQSTEGYCTGH